MSTSDLQRGNSTNTHCWLSSKPWAALYDFSAAANAPLRSPRPRAADTPPPLPRPTGPGASCTSTAKAIKRCKGDGAKRTRNQQHLASRLQRGCWSTQRRRPVRGRQSPSCSPPSHPDPALCWHGQRAHAGLRPKGQAAGHEFAIGGQSNTMRRRDSSAPRFQTCIFWTDGV